MATRLSTNLQTLLRTPMLDDKGQVQLEWGKFFYALVQAVNGALEAQEQAALAQDNGDDIHGSSLLTTVNAVPMVLFPGTLTQAAVGEASAVITYVNSVSGAGVTFTTKTVTFTNGVETAHT